MGKAKKYKFIEVKNAIIDVLKNDSYLAQKVKNFRLNAPLIYQTAMENVKTFDCPAISAFLPLEIDFNKDNDYTTQPNVFFIDVVAENSDYVIAQDEALMLCYDVKETLDNDTYLARLNPLDVARVNVSKFQELGSFLKSTIFQFAYRIHLEVITS